MTTYRWEPSQSCLIKVLFLEGRWTPILWVNPNLVLMFGPLPIEMYSSSGQFLHQEQVL